MLMFTSGAHSASTQLIAAIMHGPASAAASTWASIGQQFVSRTQLGGHPPSPFVAVPLEDPLPPELLPELPRDPLLEPTPLEPLPDPLEVLPELVPASLDPTTLPSSSPWLPAKSGPPSPALFGVLLHAPKAATAALPRSPSVMIVRIAHSPRNKNYRRVYPRAQRTYHPSEYSDGAIIQRIPAGLPAIPTRPG